MARSITIVSNRVCPTRFIARVAVANEWLVWRMTPAFFHEQLGLEHVSLSDGLGLFAPVAEHGSLSFDFSTFVLPIGDRLMEIWVWVVAKGLFESASQYCKRHVLSLRLTNLYIHNHSFNSRLSESACGWSGSG